MSIIDRLKRRLPILGAGPASSPPPPARPAATANATSAASAPAVARPAAPRPAPSPMMADATVPRNGTPAGEYIANVVKAHPIVLFMKGTPVAPQCGFSATAAGILAEYGRPLAHVNVIADPEIREAVKEFTSWPTLPQIFIGGEFVGGADILRQMHDGGELKALIEKAAPGAPAPAEA